MPSVPRLFPGETVAILSCGPSMTAADAAYVRGRARVLCVSNTYEIAPWADALYAADFKWWKWHRGASGFKGLKFSMEARAREFPDVTILRRGRTKGLSLEPGVLCTGQTSGYQAINLAVQLGASRIVLLGFDYQRGPKNEEHYFGDHPNRGRTNWGRFLEHFGSLVKPLAQAGVSIVNCSPRSAITAFPKQALMDVFPMRLERAG